MVSRERRHARRARVGGLAFACLNVALWWFETPRLEQLLIYPVKGSGSLLHDAAQLLVVVLLVGGILWRFAVEWIPSHRVRLHLLLPLLAVVLGLASSALAWPLIPALVAVLVLVPVSIAVALRHAVLLARSEPAERSRSRWVGVAALGIALLAVPALRYEDPPLEATWDTSFGGLDLSNRGMQRLVLTEMRVHGRSARGRVALRALHWSDEDSGFTYGRLHPVDGFAIPDGEGAFVEASLPAQACRDSGAPARIAAIESRYAMGDERFTERVRVNPPATVDCR